MGSIDLYFDNKKYFDFLGVKYIITDGYDFNSIVYGIPGSSGQFIELGTSTITQNFVSPVENISSIGISMGGKTTNGNKIILKLDSIPYNEKFHRESSIDRIVDKKLNEFSFKQVIENIKGNEFVLTIESEQKNNDDLVIMFTHDKSEPYVLSPSEFEETRTNFSIDGVTVLGKNTVFSLNTENEKQSFSEELVKAEKTYSSINKELKDDINENKTELMIKIMIMAAIYEFMYMHKTPEKVVINEYLKASDYFMQKSQKGFLNVVLDKLSKVSRVTTVNM